MKTRPVCFASFEQISYIAVVFQRIPMSAMAWHFKSAIENLIDMAIFFFFLTLWSFESTIRYLHGLATQLFPHRKHTKETIRK